MYSNPPNFTIIFTTVNFASKLTVYLEGLFKGFGERETQLQLVALTSFQSRGILSMIEPSATGIKIK